MKSRPLLHGGLLVCAVAVSRFLFRSHLLYDLDSVNFALALQHFDPELHQPHPPGYFLYLELGRLAFALLHDANAALVALSILGSAAAVVAIYALTDAWFGRRAALFAGLIFLFSPLCWFHGTVALTYICEVPLSALVGYCCWQTCRGRAGFAAAGAVALGAAMGLRQSSILFLGPLWLFSLTKAHRREIVLAFTALAASVFAWFVPMTLASGGPARYFASLYDLWRRVPATETVFTERLGAAFSTAITRFSTIVFIFALCFGAAAPLLFAQSEERGAHQEQRVLTWVWITPSLLFFTFVFLRFVNSGYLLAASPPIFAWLGSRTAEWYGRGSPASRQKIAVLAAVAALHTAAFLYLPLYCSYQAVRQFETDLRAVEKSLPQVADPADTMIVAFDAHFLGYRHAGFYLPAYWTVQLPEVSLPAGPRVFAMFQGQTRLLGRLPEFQKFVLFPLPHERSYREFLKQFQAGLPPGALRSQRAGDWEFLTGSAADLRLLFPLVGKKGNQVFSQGYSRP